MPGEITWTASGLFAWLAANPAAVRQEKIRAILRKCQKQAVNEWAQKHGAIGLPERFTEEGARVLDLTPRKPGYQNRQRNVLRRTLPYTSPNHTSGGMRRAVLNDGWRIRARNGTDEVTTEFTITGARQLNRIKAPYGQVYRSEFLGFSMGGHRDGEWINARVLELSIPLIVAEISKAQKRTLGAK